MALTMSGCGTTKQNTATEQVLNSDAVDATVAKIDFTPLTGQKVFFDTQYMADYKGIGFVNSAYVISSLRQQMAAAGLLLMPHLEQADYVLEGRIGVLGTDSHELIYGIPSNSAISSAASIAASATTGTTAPATIPELSLAKRNDQAAASKIGIFAYDRVSREVVWQSGSSFARATAKDFWVFGIGPFQRGSIYKNNVQFAGNSSDAPLPGSREGINGPIAAYHQETLFQTPGRKTPVGAAIHASSTEEEPTGHPKPDQQEPEKLVPISPAAIARPLPDVKSDHDKPTGVSKQAEIPELPPGR
ncbi:MAG TPA: DUF6655 family protein [Planctomicrobium sp.]|nr:DUF6655 family protein [Planctomicrobium sp.]